MDLKEYIVCLTLTFCGRDEHRVPGSPPIDQKIAIAFGGEATPPGTFNGILVRKKENRPSLAHVAANSSRSHNSPIGVPHRAIKYWWKAMKRINTNV